MFSSEQQLGKGEYTYGWYSASGGKCKAIKERLGFIAISILVGQILLASTCLLGISLYQPT
jgi:hypothetical protein